MPFQILDRVERLIRRIRVRRCQTPFVVLFIDRSGSSHFCSALDSHRDVICRREDFCELKPDASSTPPADDCPANSGRGFRRQIHGFGQSPIPDPSSRQVRTHLHDIFSLPSAASGFKFKIPIQQSLFPEVDHELRILAGDLRVIALFRNNPLKQAISRQNLKRIQRKSGNTEHNLRPGANLEPLQVDVEMLLNSVRNLQSARQTLDRMVADYDSLGMDVLRINYEDLSENPLPVFQTALRFLNVDPEWELVSSYGKATPDDLSQAIDNYDELRTAVAGTDLEQYL